MVGAADRPDNHELFLTLPKIKCEAWEGGDVCAIAFTF